MKTHGTSLGTLAALATATLVGLVLGGLTAPAEAGEKCSIRPRPARPIVTAADVGDYRAVLIAAGGTLVKGQAGKLFATVTSRTSHTPASGLQVLLIIPHLYPSTGQELMEYLERVRTFGDPDDPTTGALMTGNNIGETGNAATVEEAPGLYGLEFTPMYAAPYEVHVLILDPRHPTNLLQTDLSFPVAKSQLAQNEGSKAEVRRHGSP